MYNKKSEQTLLPQKTVRLLDEESGLNGYIAINSTRLGPAAGGCRIWDYSGADEACLDALRLAQGMAYKNALADLPLGGGKAVLLRPADNFNRERLFSAFGKAVNALDGEYVTAEDVGTSVADMEVVARETRHVAGLHKDNGQPGGDPSPWTALGVFESMKVMVHRRMGADLSQLTVAVQGLGHVGYALCELLHGAGAKLLVADPNSQLAARAAVAFDAEVANGHISEGVSAIGLAQADVFAPCALGGAITPELATRMNAKVICGAANNQLAKPEVADLMEERRVLYAPDYLVNAGGIINVAAEYLGWTLKDVELRISNIPNRLNDVLVDASVSGTTTARAADEMALRLIQKGKTLTANAA